MKLAGLLAAGLLAASAPAARADVLELAKVYGDHMVLQADRPIRLWGWADPHALVATAVGGFTVNGHADETGVWVVEHPPRAASTRPISIEVLTAYAEIELTDVLVGEVWIAAGQSNMAFELSRSADAEAALAAADRPLVRLLDWRGAAWPGRGAWTAEELARCHPDDYLAGEWSVADSSSASAFSAVAWHFAVSLDDALDVPIGIVHCAVGGTPTEAWIARETLARDPVLAPLLVDWPGDERVHPFCRERAVDNLRDAAWTTPSEPDWWPPHPFRPGYMHEAGIQHLERTPVRGVIWYQGESNALEVELHARLFRTLVGDWRARWRIGEFPFLFCQLSSIGTEGGYRSELWPEFRDSQRRLATEIANTGMAVTSDLGHPTDVHPRRKREVGERLARWALADTYGKDGVRSGPLYESWRRAGGRARVRFAHAGGGLAGVDDGELMGFELRGESGGFTAAEASIEGAEVVLEAAGVPAPAAVRYGWSPYSCGNLVNGAGLPASTFTTED